jgi:3-oxoacyl-[acyl-carrier protein] reductase
LTKAWAKETPEVNFNIINPGYVDTDMTSILDDEHKRAILKLTNSGQPIQPIDIAKCVIDVVRSGKSGQVINYDDGIIQNLEN